MSSRRHGEGAMTGRESTWRILSVLGGIVGYGCLAAFMSLVGLQVYWWFKEGEWTHISLGDAIRAVLDRMHIADDAGGRLARAFALARRAGELARIAQGDRGAAGVAGAVLDRHSGELPVRLWRRSLA